MSSRMEWRAQKRQPDEDASSDSGRSAFGDDGAELPAPVVNLVREGVQNILDKRAGGGPVSARFTLHDPSDADGQALEDTFLAGLAPHLKESLPRSYSQGRAQHRYLLLEDFGTIGLTGDVRETRIPRNWPDQADPNHFYFFWRGRNVRPRNQLGGGGSWGVGKLTFYLASYYSTIFAVSRPIVGAGNRPTLMGKALLEQHVVDGIEYRDTAHFCRSADDLTPMPITDAEAIDRFSHDWRLSRTTEDGLSIVIPHVRKEFTADSIATAVIEEYAFPILTGSLVVQVVDPSNKTDLTIDAGFVEGMSA